MREDYPLEFPTKEAEMAFKQQVEIWYEEYGEIYTAEVNDTIFIFRGVSKAEFDKSFKLYPDPQDREEYICRTCVLEPHIEDYSLEIFAGIPGVLCQMILEESGYTSDPTKVNMLIKEYEDELSNPQQRIPLIIKEVFQEYTLEEIEHWPLERTIYYYTRANWVLQNLRGVILMSEEEEKQQLEMEQAQALAMSKR